VKIKSIYISAFGGIKNLELNLESTFNIVYGDNENGKTTIMNFIKMMFYGTERGSAQLNKNLRKKYTPWDNSQMAGSIVFEHKGRTYKLERIFGNSNSTDKVTLRDLSIGTAKSVGSDIGSRLFGLSVAAFERSIFIGQFGFPDNNDLATGELNGKLSNIALTGDEAVSFDAINKRLETAKTQLMSKSGRTGIYDKNLKLCATLEGQLETEEKNQERIKDANNRIAQITEQIKLTQQKADKLKQQIESENDIRNSEKLRELLTLKAQLDDVNKGLALSDGKLADEVFVKKVEFCLNKIENIGNKIFAKQNENQLLQNNLNLALNVSGDATPQAKKELAEKKLSRELEQLIEERTSFVLKPGQLKRCEIADGVDKYSAGVVMPIISEGDPIGSVILIDDGQKEVKEVDEKLAESAAGFLGKQMEL
jgi:stage V sporulation protein T